MRHIAKAIELIKTEYKHVLEFGVFKGETISIIRNNLDCTYNVFGFDSFEGLPEDWVTPDNNVAGDGLCVKSFFSTNGEIPNIPNVKFYKGWFEDTIPEYLKLAEPIALLHIDCDLYSSTKTVLYNLNQYIVEGTLIVFDEWVYNREEYNDHEQKCFYEWVNDFNREYVLIPHEYVVHGKIINEQQIIKILK